MRWISIVLLSTFTVACSSENPSKEVMESHQENRIDSAYVDTTAIVQDIDTPSIDSVK